MKRLTVLLGDSNTRLLEEMDQISKATMFEFPENDAYKEPLTQHDRRVWISNMVDQSKYCPVVICTQDEIIFTAIRVAIHQNKITPEEVELRWYTNNEPPVILQVDKYGRLNYEPQGLFDTMEQLLCILLEPKPAT